MNFTHHRRPNFLKVTIIGLSTLCHNWWTKVARNHQILLDLGKYGESQCKNCAYVVIQLWSTNLQIYVYIIISSALLKIWFVLYRTLISPHKDDKVVYLCTFGATRSLHGLLVKVLPLSDIYVVVSVYMSADCYRNFSNLEWTWICGN